MKYAFGIAYNPEGVWWYAKVHGPWCDRIESNLLEWLDDRLNPNYDGMNVMNVAPRGTGKSVLITKGAMLFLSVLNPELSILIDSVDMDKSRRFLYSISQILRGEDRYSLFTWLYGEWYDRKRKWTSDEIVHAARGNLSRAEASFYVTSVETGDTSGHPDVTCGDDFITPEKLRELGRSTWMETCNRHVVAQIPVLKPNGLNMYQGTRYADGDVIDTWRVKQGVASIDGMPSTDEYFTPVRGGAWRVYLLDAIDELGTYGLPGSATFPKTWSLRKLRDFEKTDPVFYASQMRQRPDAGSNNPLTITEIKGMIVDEMPNPDEVYLTIHMDTAFADPQSGKRRGTGDFSVMQVWGHFRDGSARVRYLWGRASQSWSAPAFTEMFVSRVVTYRAAGYYIRCATDERELSGKQGSYKTVLEEAFKKKQLAPVPIHIFQRPTTPENKEKRIEDALTFWQAGYVTLYSGAPGISELINQVARIRVSRKDWVDCSADVFHPKVRQGFSNRSSDERTAPLGLPTDAELQHPGVFRLPDAEGIRRIIRETYGEPGKTGNNAVYVREPIE
jgi:hypothetical protein